MDYNKSATLEVKYPVFHRRKVPFRPLIEAPPGFIERSELVKGFDSELDRYVLLSNDYRELVGEAVASNIHWSTKIEGNPLTMEEVHRLTRESMKGKIAEKKPTAPMQEVLNHLSIWLDPDFLRFPWGVEKLLATHRLLMDDVSPEAKPGRFREHPGGVYSDQDQELLKACPPEHVQEELKSLLDWVNLYSPAADAAAAATVLFHEFESIHPFADGNGRVGRVLFHGYLQQRGLPNSHLCFIEQELMKDRERYYQLLAWTDQEGNYRELLDYFSQALLRSYQEADKRLRAKDLLSTDLPEVAKRITANAKRHKAWFSVTQASRWVDGVSGQTVRNRLNELSVMGVLEAIGQTRGKRYRFRPPLVELRKKIDEALGKEPAKDASAAGMQKNAIG